MKNCSECKKEFEPRNHNHVTCGVPCRNLRSKRLYQETYYLAPVVPINEVPQEEIDASYARFLAETPAPKYIRHAVPKEDRVPQDNAIRSVNIGRVKWSAKKGLTGR